MPIEEPTTSSPRLTRAIEQIEFSRGMTLRFLDDITTADWFWQPAAGMNHLAWHFGHLAFAQYFLCLKRIRDRTEADLELMPTKFLKRYKQGSQPSGDPAENFSIEEILATFHAVHQQAMLELPAYTDADLDVPTLPPHPIFDTKLGAVEWCSKHELMHAGQIVMLRRLRGKSPQF